MKSTLSEEQMKRMVSENLMTEIENLLLKEQQDKKSYVTKTKKAMEVFSIIIIINHYLHTQNHNSDNININSSYIIYIYIDFGVKLEKDER